ncbi:MAG TPA: class I SAM-dependent methyltransferase [Pyrinomonadaceae bacterium]|nr:class I SAM-dependent methyltransferase [Pyrinomonadaceae bacterium]
MNRQQRAKRALTRQLAYQQKKAASMPGREDEIVSVMKLLSANVRAALHANQPINPNARVLEVGSGAHGLIFYFGSEQAVGVDPLAESYAQLFSAWQGRVSTVAAFGEALPFPEGSFDIVLSHNVVDHAESPATIVAEIARVLKPSGLLYFTVNIHHPIYSLASWMHAAWNYLGISYEIGPFADHTVHLTLSDARRLFAGLPFRLLQETNNIAECRTVAKRRAARHAGDKLKRIFFKNAVFEVIAMREK